MAGKRLSRGIDRLSSGTYRARLTVDNIVHTIGTFQTLAVVGHEVLDMGTGLR
ncbi:hypothetical protein [Micrococcus luteus]|uniref:hypothetical protein n=1 Tax=Micrococcus luteus TaxID=1270 RepID=UPI00368947CF